MQNGNFEAGNLEKGTRREISGGDECGIKLANAVRAFVRWKKVNTIT